MYPSRGKLNANLQRLDQGSTENTRKSRTSNYRFAATIFLLLGLTTAGCSGTSHAQPLSEDARAVLMSIAGLATPEEQLRQDQKMVAEFQRQVAVCMEETGFDYDAAVLSDFSNATSVTYSFPYTEQYARSQGFGASTQYPPHGPSRSEAIVKNQKYREQLNPEARSKYDGSYSACAGKGSKIAQDTLGISNAGSVFEGIDKRVRSSAQFSTAVTAWSKCASDAGFQFGSFEDARSGFQKRVLTLSSQDRFANPPSRSLTALQDEEKKTASRVSTCSMTFGEALSALYKSYIDKI